MNKVVLVGRLTKQPELRFTPGAGKAVATFTLAVNRRFKADGQPDADFLPIVVWGKQAESAANYLTKGSQAAISGRIATRNYENKEGQKVHVTEIIADEVQFLDGKKSGQADTLNTDNELQPVNDGDIPF